MSSNNAKVVVCGEVLFDMFPDGKRLGGAPFNFAIHLHRFNLPVTFISRVGDDTLGREVLEFVRSAALPEDAIQMDPEHKTGEVRVDMQPEGGHRFEILPHRAWDFIEWTEDIESIPEEDIALVYFGTLAQREAKSRKTIRAILKKIAGRAPLFLDLNLRPPFVDKDIVEQSLELCDILKASEEEVLQLKNFLGKPAPADIPSIAETIQSRYGIPQVCVTRGENGSELYNEKGLVARAPAPTPEGFKDSVGAGDAFSACFVLGFLKGWENQKVLREASAFASKICTVSGAIPEGLEFYS